MRTVLRIFAWLVAVVVVLIGIGVAFFFIRFPRSADPPSVTVEATPDRLARGEYLWHGIAACGYCHSGVDESGHYIWTVPGTEGQGGREFELGGAGVVYARNITPAGIGEWTDGEIIRAIRDGVNADGGALFPIMPYHVYKDLSQEDVLSIVAYVRALEPRPNEIPARSLRIPLNFIVRFMPSPAPWPPALAEAPDSTDTVALGRYWAGMCAGCHTPTDERGTPLPGMDFAGGGGFPERGWLARPANITPDRETGIGAWSREDFILRFRSVQAAERAPAMPEEPRTSMPWVQFATMSDSDLGAIYDYLRTVPPVSNRVVKYERVSQEEAE